MKMQGKIDVNSGGNAGRCLKALAYKSAKLQQKRYCSNICQIITPMLCIMFTLVVKMLTDLIVSDQIFKVDVLLPFDLPPAMKLFYTMPSQSNKTSNSMTCREAYLYQYDNVTRNMKGQVDEFFSRMLQRKCHEGNFTGFTPEFRYHESVNKQILKVLASADV